MTFSQAVSTVFSKYAVFTGRASRPEFWWFALFNVIASVVLGGVDKAVFGREILSVVYGLGVLLPGLGVAIRRLHDTDRSGWWLLVGLIPLIGWIVLVYNCPEGCPELVATLDSFRQEAKVGSNGVIRAIVAPDSRIPTRVAALLWRRSWGAEAPDANAIRCMMQHQDAEAPEPELACLP